MTFCHPLSPSLPVHRSQLLLCSTSFGPAKSSPLLFPSSLPPLTRTLPSVPVTHHPYPCHVQGTVAVTTPIAHLPSPAAYTHEPLFSRLPYPGTWFGLTRMGINSPGPDSSPRRWAWGGSSEQRARAIQATGRGRGQWVVPSQSVISP
jgi:hypothetical protein